MRDSPPLDGVGFIIPVLPRLVSIDLGVDSRPVGSPYCSHFQGESASGCGGGGGGGRGEGEGGKVHAAHSTLKHPVSHTHTR